MGKASQNLFLCWQHCASERDRKEKSTTSCWKFFYYGQAVDLTILCTLNKITGQQASPTGNPRSALANSSITWHWTLTQPFAIMTPTWCSTSILMHPTLPHKMHATEWAKFFLSSLLTNRCPNHINSAILTNCTLLKCVATSTTKAEFDALFLNAMEATNMRLTLREMEHPQPLTPIHVDNTAVVGTVNNTIKRQHSRAMNMGYFWLLCQEA